MKQRVRRLCLAGFWALFGAASAAAEPLRIGVSLADLGNPFFYRLAQHLQDAAHELSDQTIDMDVVSNAYDIDRQRAQIQHFIDRQVDIIFLSAADSQAVEPAIKQARRAGIVVTAVDIDARGADVSVTTDNVQAGVIACRDLAHRLNGQGRVAIINGASVSSVTDRVAGCRAVLQEHPGLVLVSDQFNAGGTYGGGLEAMTFLLSQHPGINAVFAINDPSALGAAEAARLGQRPDILITAVDGSDAFIDAMRNGNPNLVATAAQSPNAMAWQAMAISLSHHHQRNQSPAVVRIPTELIRQEAVAAERLDSGQ